MATPKKKTSRSKSGMRRSHYKMGKPSLIPCRNCKSLITPHRVCVYCGHYKRKEVIQAEVS